MNRLSVVLVVVSLCAVVLAGGLANPGATTQDNDDAPLMVAFADLKWTKLPEREGMMFAVLFSQPLGMKLQEHVTTEADPGDLEFVQVEKQEATFPILGKQIMHRVRTRKG